MADRTLYTDNTSSDFEASRENDKISNIQALQANSMFSTWFNYLEIEEQETLKQARDSTRLFHNESSKSTVYLNMLRQYPNSPTAINYTKSLLHFMRALHILKDYKKDTVEDIEDCETLSQAFANIVNGYLYENSMFEPFQPPDTMCVLVDKYLSFRPKNICAEYVKIIIQMRASFKSEKRKRNLLSEFESAKLRITTLEMFALKLKKNKQVDCRPFNQRVLIDVYYHLGAMYVSTKQPSRALDSFQKCHDLDDTNFSALFGIAYHLRKSDPAKAIELFQTYISMAPKCDKQYPNAYYLIASIYCTQGRFEEATRYVFLAEDAEKNRLPFLPPISIPQKRKMQHLKFNSAQKTILKKTNLIE
ncbi:uncharacterized protein LOC134688361 [Mytilus trossulus]|uniref:uncharacterized protein LOC134688361 n=1 Tax=Mytilus trossulus TaxID=6551 RepID=UPI003006E1B5